MFLSERKREKIEFEYTKNCLNIQFDIGFGYYINNPK
jgi:hypothetical protein